jgi:SRSO17 transposase
MCIFCPDFSDSFIKSRRRQKLEKREKPKEVNLIMSDQKVQDIRRHADAVASQMVGNDAADSAADAETSEAAAGLAVTHEQIGDVYMAGNSDGVMDRGDENAEKGER